jgi:hypothetical protein
MSSRCDILYLVVILVELSVVIMFEMHDRTRDTRHKTRLPQKPQYILYSQDQDSVI